MTIPEVIPVGTLVMNTDTFACPLTGPGVGAIAVILLAGPRAAEILSRVCSSQRVAQLPIGQSHLAHLCHPSPGDAQPPSPIDQALIIRAGDCDFELHLHGGVAVMREAQSALQAAGATVVGGLDAIPPAAPPGLCPADAEVLSALAGAQTQTAAQLLLRQPAAWQRWRTRWSAWLAAQETSAHLWRFHAAVQWLLECSRTLQFLLTPARVALIGAPNVGKSTLANALLGRPVSITSDLAGTTRDWVDAQAIFSAPTTTASEPIEIPITLIDTAGIRLPADPLESESIARTHHQAQSADVIILLFDATRPTTAEELESVHDYPARTVLAINKTDAAAALPEALFALDAVRISARTHAGLDSLMSAALRQLGLAHISFDEPFAFNRRLLTLLQKLSLTDDLASLRHIISA